MEKQLPYFVLIFFFLIMVFSSFAAEQSWPKTTSQTRPWTRWWWHGNAVDRENLKRFIDLMADAGIGGVEITSIYGVKGEEERSLRYLSPEYAEILEFAVNYAHEKGLGVDLPTGSGWRCGGPHIKLEDADARLVIQTDSLKSGEVYEKTFPDIPQALMAFSDEAPPINLLSQIQPDGKIAWLVPAGEWTIYSVSQEWSGAKVKRPAPGGAGYSFNPYSLKSFQEMIQPFSAFFEKFPPKRVRSQFHDSFEYSGDWTDDFFAEFEKRRGYDLREFLPELSGHGSPEKVARVKCDYRETISDLVLARFILPWREWSHARGQLVRNQSHGSPGNLLDLYGAVDIPETEIFRFDDNLFGTMFASSAAHVMGRPLASSESFTWLREHFQVTLKDMKIAADKLLVGGINHIFFHGTAYSPKQADWPGWLFYASTQVNPQNTLWHNLPAFNAYLTRCQSVLQTGQPDNEILVYWPVFDFWMDPAGLNRKLTVHDNRWITENPAGDLARFLSRHGYGFDFISDHQLTQTQTENANLTTPGGSYQIVVVPECAYIPLATLRKLHELAAAGATILFENRLPKDVPGMASLEDRRSQFKVLQDSLHWNEDANRQLQIATVGTGQWQIAQNLPVALANNGILREPLADCAGLKFIRRRVETGVFYFLTNLSDTPLDGWTTLSRAFSTVLFYNPMTGKIAAAETRQIYTGDFQVRLQLMPGESMILKCLEQPVTAPKWQYLDFSATTTEIPGTWDVEFIEGGPVLPKPVKMTKLKSWTELADPETQRFAGTARYKIQFDAPDGRSFLLHLGNVRESARVRLNGKFVGTVFAEPFQIRLPELKPEKNVLEIEVTNRAANRIRDLDIRQVEWRIFHDINFVNWDYRKFDASAWPVCQSGLLGPVRLIPVGEAK